MRRTDDNIYATYINNNAVCVNSCHILKFLKGSPSDLKYKFILGLLNSKFYQRIFELQNPQMVGKTFAEIKVVYVENLPYKDTDKRLQEAIITNVDKIIELRKHNLHASTSELERQLDEIVYQIFNLSPKEIGLVESSKWLCRIMKIFLIRMRLIISM